MTTCSTCTRERIIVPDVDPVGQLVTAIMPTSAGRPAQFRQLAIESFLAQTYEPKAMVILSDGAQTLTPSLPTHDKITYVHAFEAASTGAKLNMVALRGGTIFAKWDDDDWKDPTYLETIVPLLKGKAVAGLQSIYFHVLKDSSSWILDQGPHLPIDASMVFWKATWEKRKFPDTSAGEGHRFLRSIPRRLRATAQAPHLYVAIRHDQNTTDWDPRPPGWRPAVTLPWGFIDALERFT